MKATHNPPTPAAVVEPTPADILRLAALYLQRHGWTQGDYYTVVFDATRPRADVLGAIAMTCFGRPVELPFITGLPERIDYYAAVDALVEHLGLIATSDLFAWNDHPDRTVEHVTATLLAAADTWNNQYGKGGETA